ncbi:MAG: MarR family winged helix-turn-helix transcriptional regulator [Alphaproteobacteria bacterium]|nr:MarR family winged helix-turn-helix transcriptional regulator [Alphaproteobacteria bacterium]
MADLSTDSAADLASPSRRQVYLEAIKLIERLHRQFLEVVKTELDRRGTEDINNIQALILFNIGADELTVGELTNRGYYLGSNVSYNVRKMVENKYLIQERSTHDRRSIRVRLSEKGLELCAQISDMFDRHADSLEQANVSSEDLRKANAAYSQLERFWEGLLNYNLRGTLPPL